MKYFKEYRETMAHPFEITKEEAFETLAPHWDNDALADALEKGKGFRLFTPFADVWTKTESGLIPAPGFYGICG